MDERLHLRAGERVAVTALYELSAFAEGPLLGNPAAVCVVPEWPADSHMQALAAANDASETAFVHLEGERAELRWFSHTQEVHLCGHATLAAAHVVFAYVDPGRRAIRFETVSGRLDVHRSDDGLLHLALPAYEPAAVADPPAELLAGLRGAAVEVLHVVKNFYVVLPDEVSVRELEPDLELLACLHPNGVSVTAPGSPVDFVSRYFAPSYGIPEDPVSGHPHCALVPYWAERLGRATLRARQLSERGGEVRCEFLGDRVVIAGRVRPNGHTATIGVGD